MTIQTDQLFGSVADLVEQIDGEKTAALKTAEPTPADPGGYQGASSHPSTKVDNRVEGASEGSRSSENVADNKADQGSPGVDSTSDVATGAGEGTPEQDKKQMNIGTNQSSTGADPTTENDFKETKDDDGYDADTSHPTKADKDREKFSAVTFKQAADRTIDLCESVLAKIAAGPSRAPATAPSAQGSTDGGDKEAAAAPMANKLAAAQAAINQPAPVAQFDQGYELAAALGVNQKQAQTVVASNYEHTIKEARTSADLVAGFVGARIAAEKQAMGEEAMGPEGEGEGEEVMGGDPMGEMGGGGGAPPEGGGGGGLEELLGGGGGEDPMMGGGGDPMMGGGEDPMMGGGEDPMAGGMGEDPMAGGEMGQEEALQQLISALEELGVPIESLAGAGAPGEKLANAVTTFRRSGKYEIKGAADKRARHIRNTMKDYVREIMGTK